MSVLFIGTIISKAKECSLKDKGIMPDPSGNVQRYYLEGLEFIHGSNIAVISSVRIKSFLSTLVYQVSDETFYQNGILVNSKGFFNAPIWGFIQRECKLCLACMQWAKEHKYEENIVYVYSLHSPFLKAAYIIKKLTHHTKIVVIVPDLPNYMMGGEGKLRKILKKLDSKRINHYMKYSDKFLLYTEYMAKYLNIKNGDWMVVEGLIDISKIKKNREENKYICLYAGSLLEQYEIDKMIRAFSKVSSPYMLHIYGNPKEAEVYKNDILNSRNVEYKGMITSDEVFEKMREATLLINPRPSNLELTRYSCPSKTFEYMASGSPVVMCRLKGLPEEYYQYIYTFEDESEEGFVNTFENILKKDYQELRDKGRKAQCFLMENKSVNTRFEAIGSFINS